MNVPFTTEELCIEYGEDIPQHIATKLWKYHIIPMLVVRAILDSAITASQNSGYRPKMWELRQGRSGNSEHVFNGKGAVDWTCKKELLPELLRLIIQYTDYTRIAVYDTFIHCDYKAEDGNRYIFDSTPKSEWTLRETIKIN